MTATKVLFVAILCTIVLSSFASDSRNRRLQEENPGVNGEYIVDENGDERFFW